MTKSMVKVPIYGQMEINTKVNSKMIKNMDKALILLQVEINT